MSRTLLSFALICTSLVPSKLYAKDITTSSDLVAATVYSNRAMLTRRANIEVPAGEHTIVIKGLSSNLYTDSLRAEGESLGKVVFGALTHKHVVEAELTVPKEKELSDKIQELRDNKRVLGAEKAALSSKKQFINNIGKNAELRNNEDIAEIDLRPDSWKAAANTIYEESEAILKKDIALDIQMREVEKTITKLERELQSLRTGQKSTLQVSIPIEAAQSTQVTLDLSYQIANASWRPIYDARLDTNEGKMDLIQYGAVRQQTGEDWNDIKLTLSTAQPHRGVNLPDLSPMWVNIYDGRNYAKRSSGGGNQFSQIAANRTTNIRPTMGFMAAEKDDAADMAAPARLQEVSFQTAQVNAQGFVSEYIIPGPSSVAADGSESKLLVGAFDNETKLQVQIKPQLSNSAMLVAHTKLKGDSPILAGQVNLFRDGAFVGQLNMPMLRPDESKNLGFGIDDQVSVTRRALKDEKGEAGIIGKDSTLDRHFLTEIKNLHNQPITISVLQTIPVSKDERIKVKLSPEHTTEGFKKDSDNIKGQLEWSFTLGAKENKDIKLGWHVSWPEDFVINGL
jgi:uncharacterized protein (TIGR02231 family)